MVVDMEEPLTDPNAWSPDVEALVRAWFERPGYRDTARIARQLGAFDSTMYLELAVAEIDRLRAAIREHLNLAGIERFKRWRARLRYCIVYDNEGHRYLCPADRADEARAMFDAITAFWDSSFASNMVPQGSVRVPPKEPDFVTRLEGGTLTFTDPLVNGQAP